MKVDINNYSQKINNISPAAKASFALVFAKFFQKGLSFISAPIFTRIMPAEEYGIISTFTSWQSILYIIATLNMSSGVFNNGMIDFKEDKDSFIYSIMCLANATTVICAGVYVIFYPWLHTIIGMSDGLMLIMFIYFLCTPAYNYWMGRQRFEYKYKPVTIMMMSSSLISVVLAIVLVLLASDSNKAVAKITATEIVSIGIGIVFCIQAVLKAKGKIKFSYWKYALQVSLPLIPHYLSMYILSSSDRIMITNLVGAEATAYYNVAYTVASVMLIFWNSVDAAYAPWIYQCMDDGNIGNIKKRGNNILIVFAGISLLCALFAPEIITILAPEEYKIGIYVIPAVTASVFFTACYTLYMRIELFLKKTKVIMLATSFSAALNLILNYICIRYFGWMAAAYTTLICYIVLAFFHSLNLKYLGYGDVYDNRRISLIAVVMVILSFGVMFVYQWNWIRYALILMILVIATWKRKDIVSILKKEKE